MTRHTPSSLLASDLPAHHPARSGQTGRRSTTGSLIAALGVAAILLYLSPLLVQGQDAYLLIHDYLDSSLVRQRVLAESGKLLASGDAVVAQPLGGIPRGFLGSELRVQVWLHLLLPPFGVVLLNQLLIRLVAFFGMWLLLARHVVGEKTRADQGICAGVSIGFAVLPFWPGGGLSVAGLPLALWAMLSIREGRGRWGHWASLLAIPFYSSFVASTVFFLFGMGCLGLLDLVRRRRLNVRFLLAMVAMATACCVVEHRLIGGLLAGQAATSQRSEIIRASYPLGHALRIAWKNLLHGQYHAFPVQQPLILGTTAAAGVVLLLQRKWDRRFALLLAAAGATALIYGLTKWEGVASVTTRIPLIRSFNLGRFHWLQPLLFHALFALSLARLWRWSQERSSRDTVPGGGRRARATRVIATVGLTGLLIGQIGLATAQMDYLRVRRKQGITYRQFFAEKSFAAIARYIGKPKQSYRVLSLGLHPAIAQYNGFYTADGYYVSYPLAYKHRFRKIIAAELDRNPRNKRYFDRWGSRCYAFVAELRQRVPHRPPREKLLRKLQLDRRAMWTLGVRYVLSAVRIAEPAQSGLIFERSFRHPESAWDVYLYRVAPPPAPPASRH